MATGSSVWFTVQSDNYTLQLGILGLMQLNDKSKFEVTENIGGKKVIEIVIVQVLVSNKITEKIAPQS